MMTTKVATYNGKPVDITQVTPDDIDIRTIAHSLSMQCRFNGHVKKFYSVAEHSVKMANIIEKQGFGRMYQIYGLLHDAPEAYIGDIVTPIKRYFDLHDLRVIEYSFIHSIWQKLLLSQIDEIRHISLNRILASARDSGIVEIDWGMMCWEGYSLIPNFKKYIIAEFGKESYKPVKFQIDNWVPTQAEYLFKATYRKIINGIRREIAKAFARSYE